MTGVLDILESVDNSSSVISYIGFDVSPLYTFVNTTSSNTDAQRLQCLLPRDGHASAVLMVEILSTFLSAVSGTEPTGDILISFANSELKL